MVNDDFKVVFAPSLKLRNVSKKVKENEFGEELDEHMEFMLTKMRELRGFGLAGVQIGDERRLLVADTGDNPLKLVNPEIIEEAPEKVSYREGCLSIPGLNIDVERSREIAVKYLTPLGEEREEIFSDVNAVVVQHEIDHLNGITLLDKISRLKKDIYLRKMRKMQKKILKRINKYSQPYY